MCGAVRQFKIRGWSAEACLLTLSMAPAAVAEPLHRCRIALFLLSFRLSLRCPPNSGFSQLLFSVSVSFVFLSRNLRQLVEVRKRGSVQACLPLVFLEGVGRQVTHENTFLGQLLFSATLGTASAGTSSVNEGRPLAGSVRVPKTAAPSYGCPGLA